MKGDTQYYNPIIELLQQGESPQLNRLLSELRGEVTEYIRRKFNVQVKEAEEHAQSAVCQLLHRLLKADFKAESVGGYTAVCAQNNYLAKYKREKVVYYADVSEWIIPKEPEPLSDMYYKETERLVESTINEMSKKAQRVTRLYLDLPDLNYKEAAKTLGMSWSNVRTIKSRAFDKLRERLTQLL